MREGKATEHTIEFAESGQIVQTVLKGGNKKYHQQQNEL